ncbi:hypothetical protein M0R45_024682 [Rubus argutus]|uniref:Secreted protein n=1 Tax=Rubus argutus TaxID=59490 RepID=A0AAW1WTW3_RUBAR
MKASSLLAWLVYTLQPPRDHVAGSCKFIAVAQSAFFSWFGRFRDSSSPTHLRGLSSQFALASVGPPPPQHTEEDDVLPRVSEADLVD